MEVATEYTWHRLIVNKSYSVQRAYSFLELFNTVYLYELFNSVYLYEWKLFLLGSGNWDILFLLFSAYRNFNSRDVYDNQ